jgi:hypothetical protein
MLRVYVAGALNADAVGYIKNIHRMNNSCNTLRNLGYAIYNPSLDFLERLQFGDYEYIDYFKNNEAWLEVSDAIFLVPGWENSSGTKKEIERAKELNIPVFDDIEMLMIWESDSRHKILE